MGSFEQMMEFIFAEEGGFVDHASDPGGATNLGITLGTLRRQGAWGDLDGDGDIDAQDVKLLTRTEAMRVYREGYWAIIQGDNWHPALALGLLDGAINMGPVTAVSLMQTAMRCTADGVVGPETVRYGRTVPLVPTLNEYHSRRAVHYATRPHFKTFGLGWMRRLMRCHAECLRLA